MTVTDRHGVDAAAFSSNGQDLVPLTRPGGALRSHLRYPGAPYPPG